jgi:hypothetical protein
MSNCFNSGINKIFVMTQFNSASLNRHIHRTYLGGGINFTDGSVEVIHLNFLTCFSYDLIYFRPVAGLVSFFLNLPQQKITEVILPTYRYWLQHKCLEKLQVGSRAQQTPSENLSGYLR